jgi:hypothetical protein
MHPDLEQDDSFFVCADAVARYNLVARLWEMTCAQDEFPPEYRGFIRTCGQAKRFVDPVNRDIHRSGVAVGTFSGARNILAAQSTKLDPCPAGICFDIESC